MSDRRLFGRSFLLRVGDTDLTGLAVTFSIKKTLKAEPNTADIAVYNLAPATRKKFEQEGTPNLVLQAGYGATLSTLYSGQVRTVHTERGGPDTITSFSSGDGEKAQQNARINLSVGPGTPPDVALRQIVATLGIGKGNIEKAVSILKAKGLTTIFSVGTAFSGSTVRVMNDFCRSAQLEWSIQDGNLQILNRGHALETDSKLLLTPTTGLIGSPSVDNKKILSAECLIVPELRPGIKLRVESELVTGDYRVSQVEYHGETEGNAWSAKITGDPLK